LTDEWGEAVTCYSKNQKKREGKNDEAGFHQKEREPTLRLKEDR